MTTRRRYIAARITADRAESLREFCQGLELARFERDRILKKVSQDEAIRLLLETDLARKHRELARKNIRRAKL